LESLTRRLNPACPADELFGVIPAKECVKKSKSLASVMAVHDTAIQEIPKPCNYALPSPATPAGGFYHKALTGLSAALLLVGRFGGTQS
jgi:hypothetical protein